MPKSKPLAQARPDADLLLSQRRSENWPARSTHFRKMSNGKWSSVAEKVGRGNDLLKAVSSINISEENLKAHARIKSILDSVVTQNGAIAEILKQTAASSQQTEQSVSGAIVEMQFQDRVMQRIQNVNGALAVIGRSTALAAESQPGLPDAPAGEPAGAQMLQEIADAFSLSEMRDRFAAAVKLQGHPPRSHRGELQSAPASDVEVF